MPLVNKVVKLVSGGIGLASEAIEDHKQRKAYGAGNEAESSSAAAARPRSFEPSRDDSAYHDAPPEYVVTSEEHADQLVATGKALPVDGKELSQNGYRLEKKGLGLAHSGRESARDGDQVDELSYALERTGGSPDRKDTYFDTCDREADGSPRANDETDWALDEAAEAAETATPPTYGDATHDVSSNKLIAQVLGLAGPVPAMRYRLPAPVILPQRRPHEKGRGFVRAYSPVLEGAGIGQDCFIAFIKNWHQASQASPWLNVVLLGSIGAGFAPSAAAGIASMVVQAGTSAAIEMQQRRRTKTFLDEMNDHLFKPRGLYAMVFAFKPDATQPVDAQDVNLNETIARGSGTPGAGRIKSFQDSMQVNSGTTYNELALPEAAPLVFPTVDTAAFSPGAKKQNAFKNTSKFVAGYLDRRAQAKFHAEHSSTPLAVGEQPRFASRFGDPNNPVNNGNLLSLVTGGAYEGRRGGREDGGGRLSGRSREKRGANRSRSRSKSKDRSRLRSRPSEEREQRGARGLKKKMMAKDVLYLMIVNLPSEEEIASAKEQLAMLQSGSPQQRPSQYQRPSDQQQSYRQQSFQRLPDQDQRYQQAPYQEPEYQQQLYQGPLHQQPPYLQEPFQQQPSPDPLRQQPLHLQNNPFQQALYQRPSPPQSSYAYQPFYQQQLRQQSPYQEPSYGQRYQQ